MPFAVVFDPDLLSHDDCPFLIVPFWGYGCSAKPMYLEMSDQGLAFKSLGLRLTLTYQNPLFRRVPVISLLGLIIRTYKKVGFGSLR